MTQELSDDEVMTAAPVAREITEAEMLGQPEPVNTKGVRKQADKVFEQPVADPKAAPKPAPSFDEGLQKVFGPTPVEQPAAPVIDPNRSDVELYRNGGLEVSPPAPSGTNVLPKATRRNMMDAYTEGNVASGRDWYNRATAEVIAADDEAQARKLRAEKLKQIMDDTSPLKQIIGPVSETITNQVTGLIAAVPGVAVGIYKAIKEGDAFEFTKAFQETQERLTYQPESFGGKAVLGALDWIMKNLDTLGEKMAENTPYGRSIVGGKGGAVKVDPKAKSSDLPPAVQALIYTSVAGAPLLLGLKQTLMAKPKTVDPRVDAAGKHGDAIEGSLPNPSEFTDVATVLAGAEPGSTAVIAARLRNIYTETGRRPADVLADAQKDPVLAQQLLVDGDPIPSAYKLMVEPDLDFTAPPVPVTAEAPKTVATDLAWRMKDRDRTVDPSSTDLKALTESIKKDGIKEPITITVSTADDMAYVTDGNNRLAAARELGIKDVPIRIETTEVPFTAEQRAKALTLEEMGWADENLPTKRKTQEQLDAEAWLRDQVADQPLGPLDEAQAAGQAVASATGRGQGGGGGQPPAGQAPAGGPPKPPTDPVRATLDRIGEEARPGMTAEGLYTRIYDDLYPISRDVKAAREQAGLNIRPEDDAYMLMRNSRGAGLAAEVQIERGPRRLDGTHMGVRGLQEIFKDAEALSPGKNLDELRAYMIALRDFEKLNQGIKTGGDIGTALDVVKELGPKYAPLAREIGDFQNAMAQKLVDAGVVSPEAFAKMKVMNDNYIPFFRIVGEDVIGGAKGKGVQDPIRAMTGSDAQIVDPLQSIIKNAYLFQDIAMRNVARQKYVEMGEAIPGLTEKVQRMSAIDITPEVQKALKDAGIDPELADTFMAFRRETPNARNNEINVFRNGKREVYRVESDIAEAFNGMTVKQQNLGIKLAGAFARWLHAGVTLSPDFIIKNAIRDPVDAWVKTGMSPLSPITKGLKSALTKDEAFDQWAVHGGGMGALTSLDRNYINREIHKLNADTGFLSRAWNVVNTPLDALKLLSEKSDQMVRLAEHRRQIANGASPVEATFRSREATADFARRGSDGIIAGLKGIVPFFNVGLQAPERFARALKDNPAGTTARLGLLAAGSLALYEYARTQPGHEELSPFERDMYWNIPVGDYWIKIPKPQEAGLIFASGTERIAEAAHKDKVDGIADWSEQVGQQLTPSVIPQVVRPVLEGHYGLETRFGRPLVPAYLEEQLPPYQYTEATSEIAKQLGQMIGALPKVKILGIDPGRSQISSPIVLENYLRQWSGSMGQNALKLVDQLAQRSGALPEKYPAAMQLYDIPFVKAFVVRYPSSTSESIQKFEERYGEKQKLQNTVDAQMKLNPEQALELQVTSIEDTIRLRDIKQSLSNQRMLIQRINALPYDAMSKEEKAQIIESTYFQMIELAKAGNSIYDAIEKGVKEQGAVR